MQHFPVISSILFADAVAGFVQEAYQFNKGTTGKLLKTGINHSYLICNDEDQYVFRVYSLNWRSVQEIEEEIRLLRLLHNGGIPISYPIADSDAQFIQEIEAPEGLRYGVLFSFAEGEKYLNFSAELHHQVGATMAGIHKLTQGLDLQRTTYTPAVILQSPFAHLGKFLPGNSEEMGWMLSAQKYLLEEINGADISRIRKGAVHLDIWFDNMNISKDGRITIFDFDFCGNGWLCFDIAYYILQLHSTEKDATERDAKLKAFMEGYEAVAMISDEEKRLLPVLGVSLYFFYLGVQCQRFNDWSNVFLNETYLKRFINLLVKKYFDEQVRKAG